jgi:hypothetical protein
MSAYVLFRALLVFFAAFPVGGVRAMRYTTGSLHIALALVLASEVMAELASVRQGGAHLMRPPREETTWPA